MRTAAVIATVLFASMLAGCGGGGSKSSDEPPLPDGVYQYELTEQYLQDNGISIAQAENESGTHKTTIWENGSFMDSWRTATGRTGSCNGTYEADGNRVTFRWKEGCFGDWAMSYSVDGDTVSWSDFEALDPYATEDDQNVTEVFNGVPWTRVGDAPAETP